MTLLHIEQLPSGSYDDVMLACSSRLPNDEEISPKVASEKTIALEPSNRGTPNFQPKVLIKGL